MDADDDIVEISPPIYLFKKQKRAILYDVIDIDDDDDSDLEIIGEKVGRSNKGKKTIDATNQDVLTIEDNDDSDDLVIIGEKVDNSNKGKKTIEAVNQDVHDMDYDLSLNKNEYKNSPWYNDSQSSFKNSHVTDSSQVSWSLQPSNSKIQGSTRVSSSSLQEIKLVNIYRYSSGIEQSSQDVPSSKKKSPASLGQKSSDSENMSQSFCSKRKSAGLDGNPETRKLVSPSKPPFPPKFTSAEKASSSSPYHTNFKDESMKNFVCLEHFVPDIDFPLYFVEPHKFPKERTKNWAKRIQKEWKILEKNLPDSIFVRVYESRMDVMRAVIIGAKGTPYHDGLFFFDLYFPNNFPDVPPQLYFHQRCGFHSLNPNLTPYGGVCLSLLNKTMGNKKECWIPRVSTVLQVLVSIQGLVLTAHPMYNSSGHYDLHKKGGPIKVTYLSWRYNEKAFIASLWTMIHIIIRPPKDFEDLVKEHFRNHSHDIILACEAYMEGARVGSLGENGSYEVDFNYKNHQKPLFEQFKNSLHEPMEKLVEELTIFLGLKSSNSERLSKSFCSKMKSAGLDGNPETRKLVSVSKPPFSPKFTSAEKASSSIPYHANFKDEIMKNFACLKHFVRDIDFPHSFNNKINKRYKPPRTKNWTIHIQKEWKILEKNLPDSIFVRVYESQMDVMRVAIIGAKGTPYHDGLFFFDLYFPNKFPDVPPQLYFHNRYRFLSLNPNFEPNGIVCLSLLNNTKKRYTTECWIPRVSTVLQVLVSIQDLVLTAHPLYTGFEYYEFFEKGGPIKGESSSWRYSEEVFIGSLWTMIHIIRRPPKDFEDLVKEHFRNCSHDIISACEAYMEGARVGSLGENESQEVDLDYKYHQKLFFEQFKNSLREPMEKLVEEFTRIWDMY